MRKEWPKQVGFAAIHPTTKVRGLSAELIVILVVILIFLSEEEYTYGFFRATDQAAPVPPQGEAVGFDRVVANTP